MRSPEHGRRREAGFAVADEAGRRQRRRIPGSPAFFFSFPPTLRWCGFQMGAAREPLLFLPRYTSLLCSFSSRAPLFRSVSSRAPLFLPRASPFHGCGVHPTPWRARRRHTHGSHGELDASIGKSPRRLGDAMRTMLTIATNRTISTYHRRWALS